MHLNPCTGTGNQFNLIQPQHTYSSSETTVQSHLKQLSNLQATNLNNIQQTNLQLNQQQIDDSSQLNSSLSGSSGVGGCTSTSSSGLGTTSSLFSSSSLNGTTTLNTNNQNTMNGSNNNGSLINVLMPLADMNSHNLHRAQLISNLNGSNNQYTTLTFQNTNYSSTSSPSSVNTNGTSSTLPSTVPINGQQLTDNKTLTAIYLQNGQLLNDNNVYCQTTSFNNAMIDNNLSNNLTNSNLNSQLPAHYQLLPNKQQSNYHLTNSNLLSYPTTHNNSNYLLQTVPSNQSANVNHYGNLTNSNTYNPPSINYLNNDELNKFNLDSNAQFDLICDNRLSPVYSTTHKLSPNSNSLIKECLITNAENALNRNSSKFIELTSSQNSTASVYSDTLKSKLASSTNSKDNLKLINAANTGLDLLNCDKTYNEIIKNSDHHSKNSNRTDKCKKDNCNKKCKDSSSDKNLKDQHQSISTKISKSNNTWCCSSNDNPKKQGICFIILATCILVLLLCFLSLTTSPKFSSLLGKL